MSTSGSLLPVVLRGARPGELPVVRWLPPVVPSAQLVDHGAGHDHAVDAAAATVAKA